MRLYIRKKLLRIMIGHNNRNVSFFRNMLVVIVIVISYRYGGGLIV
ncbi:hypothetical protein LL912_22680 [Niabella sp. CC-SYL272]|nr:hypothetical protein [Niabella agricola]MCF3111610.1 hypothetical protein [Niabella agricola]